MNPTPTLPHLQAGAVPRRTAARAVTALALSTALATALAGCGASVHDHEASGGHAAGTTEPVMVMTHGGTSSATVALYGEMRELWAQHMEWTYSAVVAFAADSPGLTATIDRLLANQVDIGDAVKPFYGARAAARLTELLQTHIKDAVPVLQAAKAGDTKALDQAVDAWFANAQEIADFLAAANPRSWPRAEMRVMMRQHISQTIAYASDELHGDYAAAIAHYGTAEEHMMDMADMLSAGLVAQFPARFAG